MGTTRSRSGGSQQRDRHHSQPGDAPKTGFVLPREGRCRVRRSTTTTKAHHQRDNVVVADRGGRMTDESQTPPDNDNGTARLWRNKTPLRQQAKERRGGCPGVRAPSGERHNRRAATLDPREQTDTSLHSTRGKKLTRADANTGGGG